MCRPCDEGLFRTHADSFYFLNSIFLQIYECHSYQKLKEVCLLAGKVRLPSFWLKV